jgi:hypothetical protein
LSLTELLLCFHSLPVVLDESGANSDRVAGARERLQENQIRRSLRFRFQRPDRLVDALDARRDLVVVDLFSSNETLKNNSKLALIIFRVSTILAKSSLFKKTKILY